MIKKKVCMVGAFAVGKTSLVQQFVNGIFNDRYLTTVGVKIDRKEVKVNKQAMQLLLWDIQGQDELSKMHLNYLSGSSAIMYVVDGTRLETLHTALEIKNLVDQTPESSIPFIVLFNKVDLLPQWEISQDYIDMLGKIGIPSFHTSSKDSTGVNQAFNVISRMMVEKTPRIAA